MQSHFRRSDILGTLLFGFLHFLHFFGQPLVQIAPCLLVHLHDFGIHKTTGQLLQASYELGDGGRDIQASTHAFVPAPRAICMLQVLQFQGRFRQFGIHTLHLERIGYARFRLGEMRQQSIGIVSRSPRKSIVVFRIGHHLQGLNGIPHRIARELDHHLRTAYRRAMMIEQALQRISERTLAIGIQQDAFRELLLVAEHRQITLFAIAERIAIGHHANGQSFVLVAHLEAERYLARFSGLHHKRRFLRQDNLFGIGHKDFHSCHTLRLFIGKVDERSRNVHLIAHPHEARKIGLKHEFLAGHHLVHKASVIHILGMRQPHELPFGKAFGKCKLDAHFAIGIRTELRIEEGGLCKVGTKLNLIGGFQNRFFYRRILLHYRNDFLLKDYHIFCISHASESRSCFVHPHALKFRHVVLRNFQRTI